MAEAQPPILEGGQPTGPFRALRHRSFRRFWIAQVISLTGSWMQGVAQRWLVYVLTRSPAMLGIVNALGALPAAALAPACGAVADRVEKRRILIWSQIVPTLLALALWALTAGKWVRVWHVVALSLVLGVVRAFEIPTRQSLWAEIVPKRDLMSAITLNTASVSLTRILGPALAGVLIAAVSLENCFLLNAMSFVAPLWVLWVMAPTPVALARTEPFWHTMRDGLRYVRGNRPVRLLLLLVGSWSLFASQFDVLLPALSSEVFRAGGSGYGFMAAAVGAGALVGAIAAASIEQFGRRGYQVVIGSVVAALALASLSFVRSYALGLVCLFILGLGMVMQNTTTNTLVQTIVPDELRGRVMGVYSFMFIGLTPLGSLFYAALARGVGPAGAPAIGALCFAADAYYFGLTFYFVACTATISRAKIPEDQPFAVLLPFCKYIQAVSPLVKFVEIDQFVFSRKAQSLILNRKFSHRQRESQFPTSSSLLTMSEAVVFASAFSRHCVGSGDVYSPSVQSRDFHLYLLSVIFAQPPRWAPF